MKKKTINLGSANELEAKSDLVDADWNFVLIHRTDSPILSWWGNFCGDIEHRLVVRADAGKPIRWYHHKLFDYVSIRYLRYGDYYRILDNSFGTAKDDTIYEETRD